MVCLTYFYPVYKGFFHFSAAFWLYPKKVINLLSERFDRLLCECATGMKQVRLVSTLSGTVFLSRVLG